MKYDQARYAADHAAIGIRAYLAAVLIAAYTVRFERVGFDTTELVHGPLWVNGRQYGGLLGHVNAADVAWAAALRNLQALA